MELQKDYKKTYLRAFFYGLVVALIVFVPLSLSRGG